MSSFAGKNLNYNVQSGNDAAVFIGDVRIAFGQDLTMNTSYGTQALRGIGSAMIQEIQQLIVTPSITLSNLYLSKRGTQQLGLQYELASVLGGNQFTIALHDSDGNQIRQYLGCVCDTDNLNAPVNAVFSESVTFMAKDVLDANGVSLFTSNSFGQPVSSTGQDTPLPTPTPV